MNININFGGFYNSHHEYIIERAVAYQIDAVDDSGEIDHDKIFDFNEWDDVQIDYSKQWLDMLNDELGTEIKFLTLISPREYNFHTDTISANITQKDALKIFEAIKEYDLKNEVFQVIKNRTTSYDGYRAFYKYGDIFERDQWHFLIEFMLDVLIETYSSDYPFICEDFYT